MSFGLGNHRTLDPGEGVVMISQGEGAELPPLPDNVLQEPDAGRLDPREWFADPTRAFELEIGSGKGTFLVQQAELQPEINFLGIEWANEFCKYAADRIRRRREADGGLSNVRMLHTDATEFLRWRCPAELCRVIHLYFSDPWPKAKHHKKRVVQHHTLAQFWRCLQPNGELRVVTDHDDLWTWDRKHFDRWTTPEGWALLAEQGIQLDNPPTDRAPFQESPFNAPDSAGDGELVGTNFERKFREEGRSFNATVLRKVTPS